MSYLVKSIATATADSAYYKKGETVIHFLGKGGCVHTSPYFENGWDRKHFAQKCIQSEKEWNEKHETYWDYQYEIIEAVPSKDINICAPHECKDFKRVHRYCLRGLMDEPIGISSIEDIREKWLQNKYSDAFAKKYHHHPEDCGVLGGWYVVAGDTMAMAINFRTDEIQYMRF